MAKSSKEVQEGLPSGIHICACLYLYVQRFLRSGAVSEAMFDHVGSIHQDVRMNNRVQKDYIEFVGEWKKTRRMAGGTTGAGQKRKRATAAGKKKKKANADDDMDVDDEGDSDGDYEEAPKPKKVSSHKPATQKAAPSASTPKLSSPHEATF